MRLERIHLNTGGAYMDCYFLDTSEKLRYSTSRPVVVICPGGGYLRTSDREGEPIAMAFAAQGFHTVVLRYPCAPTRFPTALLCLGEAMLWLRGHAAEYSLNPDQIAVSGYSAGGHLAASLGVFWQEPFMAEHLGCKSEDIRPNAMILGYPVITSGEFAHRGSFENLLGESPSPERLEYVSLEKRVTAATPPAFLWTTYTDEIVPMENTMLFASALRTAGVPFELHVYSIGEHGLGLAGKVTENHLGERVCPACEGWVTLACAWLHRQCGQW